jgi:hypothetical protein
MSSTDSVVPVVPVVPVAPLVDQHPVTSMCQSNDAEEQLVHLWRGPDKVSLSFEDSLDGSISKVVNVQNTVLLMTTTSNLYHGNIVTQASTHENESSSTSLLTFKRTRFSAIDVAGNSEHAFIVTSDGHVLKIHPKNLEIIDTIVLRDDTNRSCNEYVIFLVNKPFFTIFLLVIKLLQILIIYFIYILYISPKISCILKEIVLLIIHECRFIYIINKLKYI